MNTRRSHAPRRWVRKTQASTHANPSFAAPQAVHEPPRESATELHLGPYESAYDIALGYGFERAIVTP